MTGELKRLIPKGIAWSDATKAYWRQAAWEVAELKDDQLAWYLGLRQYDYVSARLLG